MTKTNGIKVDPFVSVSKASSHDTSLVEEHVSEFQSDYISEALSDSDLQLSHVLDISCDGIYIGVF